MHDFDNILKKSSSTFLEVELCALKKDMGNHVNTINVYLSRNSFNEDVIKYGEAIIQYDLMNENFIQTQEKTPMSSVEKRL